MTNDEESEKILTLRVECLSGIAELEKECSKHGLNLSKSTEAYLMRLTLQKLGATTAQKLISTLVDKGKISWSDVEDFEVEAILDYCLGEDGEKYYLIKWKGWNSKYNSWEPENNLNCADLIEKYHEIHNRNRRKRKRVSVLDETDDDLKTGQERLEDLYRKLVRNCESLTPYQLLRLDENLDESHLKKYRERGLIASVGEITPHQFKKMSGTLARKSTKSYKEMKSEIQKAIKAWEKSINEINTDPAPIYVENDCDLEGPPAGFTYISDYIPGPGIELPNDPLIGCECADCNSCRRRCCPANMGCEQAYNKHKKLRVPPGTPLYECNRRCACDESCPNRVVQLGRKWKVCIFRTSNSRGWGVKTRQKIKKGSFVMEYVGEVITSEEAEARGKVYDSEGMTYLFDLDFNDGDNPFTVDARNYGNVSHFVNHSCEPNLAVYGVWINNLDPSLPRIALFARRDIERGEELTFDYMMKLDHHTLVMSPFTSPRKEMPVQVDGNCESRTNGAHEFSSADVMKLAEKLNGLVVKPVAEKSNESAGTRRDDSEIDYIDFLNNNGMKTPTKDEKRQPKEDFPMVEVEKPLNFTPRKYVLDSEVCTPKLRSPFKSQSMGIRTPIGAKNRIKCQCGANLCRGFLF